MKKPELNEAEKQFLRSLDVDTPNHIADPSRETSVEVPTDLLGKLLDLAEVSLDAVKQAPVEEEASSPWKTRLTASETERGSAVNVSDDAVAALQAFPIKTSANFSFVSEENERFNESVDSRLAEPPPEEEVPTTQETSTPAAMETSASSVTEEGAANVVEPAELSDEVTDISGALPPLQSKAEPKSFVGRLSRLFSRRKLAKFLGELEMFQELGSAALSQIAQRVTELNVEAGTPIIRRGDFGDCMYILAQGEVSIPIQDQTTQQQYAISLGPGQLFGEMALLTGEKRFADVIAQTDCSCLVLRKNDVDELLVQLPEIARLLTSVLGKRLMQGGQLREVSGYKILGELGRGGMAYVFEAIHKRKDRVVAMKMLSHELVYQGDFAERFRMEAEVLASLRHPHIVDFIAIQEAYATFFLIMEKLNGLDLNQRIERTGAFSASETREILIQAAKALAYAHDHGIIHRDIKPSNIMFTESGEVKVGDFGLALQVQEDGGSESGAKKAIEGTPTYMAPEQILRQSLDRRVDIYALGVVAYKMLIGKPPFSGSLQEVLHAHVHTSLPSLRETLPQIPEDVEAFVQKATAKQPAHRFQDAREILTHFGVEIQEDALPPLGVRTLTFVFTPGDAREVDEIIDACLRQSAAIPGLQVHASKPT